MEIEQHYKTSEQKDLFIQSVKANADELKRMYEAITNTIFFSKASVHLEDMCTSLEAVNLRDRLMSNFMYKDLRRSFFSWWDNNSELLKHLPEKEKGVILTFLSAALLSNGDVEAATRTSTSAINYLSNQSSSNKSLANLLHKTSTVFLKRGEEDIVTKLFLDSLKDSRKDYKEDYLNIYSLQTKENLIGGYMGGPKHFMSQVYPIYKEDFNDGPVLMVAAVDDYSNLLGIEMIDLKYPNICDPYNQFVRSLPAHASMICVTNSPNCDEDVMNALMLGKYSDFAKFPENGDGLLDALFITEPNKVRSLLCTGEVSCCPIDGWYIEDVTSGE